MALTRLMEESLLHPRGWLLLHSLYYYKLTFGQLFLHLLLKRWRYPAALRSTSRLQGGVARLGPTFDHLAPPTKKNYRISFSQLPIIRRCNSIYYNGYPTIQFGFFLASAKSTAILPCWFLCSKLYSLVSTLQYTISWNYMFYLRCLYYVRLCQIAMLEKLQSL